MAAEVKPYNVAAFAIEPGTVPTDLARGTVANPSAQKWMPNMVERFTGMLSEVDPEPGLAKCAELCAKLASGRYDALSGQYLDVRDDIDATSSALGYKLYWPRNS